MISLYLVFSKCIVCTIEKDDSAECLCDLVPSVHHSAASWHCVRIYRLTVRTGQANTANCKLAFCMCLWFDGE